MTTSRSSSSDAFTIEHHGDVIVIVATPALESLDPDLEDQVAEVLLAPLNHEIAPQVIFDLKDVNYFGSMFLTLLLRCWKLVSSRGGMMALAGVSPHARELLRVTSLDMIWPMYANRREAMEAMFSD